jgi:hypothetical protein
MSVCETATNSAPAGQSTSRAKARRPPIYLSEGAAASQGPVKISVTAPGAEIRQPLSRALARVVRAHADRARSERSSGDVRPSAQASS